MPKAAALVALTLLATLLASCVTEPPGYIPAADRYRDRDPT